MGSGEWGGEVMHPSDVTPCVSSTPEKTEKVKSASVLRSLNENDMEKRGVEECGERSSNGEDGCETMINENRTCVSAGPVVSGQQKEEQQRQDNEATGSGDQPSTFERPSDADIVEQENLIRKEQEARQLLGAIEPLESLSAEYADDLMRAKILAMRNGDSECTNSGSNDRNKSNIGNGIITNMRRTRGDGNCFYRSFIFGYFEKILKNNDIKEAQKAKAEFKGWGEKLARHGFHELVYEDALAEVIRQLDMIIDEQMSFEILLQTHNNVEIGNYIIMLLRFITSSELQTREEFFAPFVIGMTESVSDVTQFCRQYVEPMGEESDHVHIIALTDALKVPIRVFYLDRSNTMTVGRESLSNAVTTHQFTPSECFPDVFYVTLLYRPGHYDLLYSIET